MVSNSIAFGHNNKNVLSTNREMKVSLLNVKILFLSKFMFYSSNYDKCTK